MNENLRKSCTTVDGWNPAPVDRQFIPLFTRFYTSQVVQDFFHQLYYVYLQASFQGILGLWQSKSWWPKMIQAQLPRLNVSFELQEKNMCFKQNILLLLMEEILGW